MAGPRSEFPIGGGAEVLEAIVEPRLLLEETMRLVGDEARVGAGEVGDRGGTAELAQLRKRERVRVLVPLEGRRVVEGQAQVRVRLVHGLGEGDGRLAVRARQLRPHQVHAGVGVGAAAADGLLEAAAHRAVGVGAGDDDEVRVQPVAGVDRGAVLPDGLVERNDRLAGDVAAPLGEDLVLDVDAGHAAAHVLLHRADGR